MSDSEHNKRLIQSLFEAANRGDRTYFFDHIADDVVHTVTGECSWSGVYRGKQSVAQDIYALVAQRAPGPRRTVPYRFLADGEWVVVEAHGDMTTREGTPYRNHYCLMYRVVADRIVEMREYMDTAMCERLLGPHPGRHAA